MYWHEMSYRREHMTIRQRLQVEPEWLDEYSDDQLAKDVANEPYESDTYFVGCNGRILRA